MGARKCPPNPQPSDRPAEPVPLLKTAPPDWGLEMAPKPPMLVVSRQSRDAPRSPDARGAPSYWRGEKEVGRQILLTTRSTSGPFASLALRAASHSGSAMNAFHARSRCARSSYEQM